MVTPPTPAGSCLVGAGPGMGSSLRLCFSEEEEAGFLARTDPQ